MAMQAVIMAGGAGMRLRPMTCDCPKPLVPLCGAPVMDYALRLLARYGYDCATATLCYRPQDIKSAFGEGRHGVTLRYSEEKTPLGTAGSVLHALEGDADTVLVLSGDGLTGCDLSDALRFHQRVGAAATLVLKSVDIPLAYGVVVTDERGRILRFIEKPDWSRVVSSQVNTGVYLLEREALALIPKDRPFDFGRELFPLMLQKGMPLYGYPTRAYWCDVGDPAALLRAQGEHVGFWTTVKIGLIGIYYSYITPSSTGGQPAQVVYLRRDKVSVGNSTAVLFVKFFAYQLAFVLCTVASLIYMYPRLKRDDPQLIPIVLLGIAINGLWIIAIPLLFSPKILKKLCGGVTKLLLKCTFLKKRENYMEKVHGFEADFSSYTMKFRSKMRYVFLAILWSIPQVILQMSVLYVVFRAFSLDLPYGELLCMQTMLQASVCFIPLPGASGAQELGFSMFFKSYFASGDILYTAVLVWRFFTYYIIVLLGALVVVIDQLVFGCRRKQEAALSAGKE